MNINFNVYHCKFDDRSNMLSKSSAGVVKCQKDFPIFVFNGKQYLFKPLSKPYGTFLFAYSEVFWSNIINNYFCPNAPLYYLAICEGYSRYYPSRSDKGTLTESITTENERLVNLLEYFNAYTQEGVDIGDYVNYCGVYYDYTNILNAPIFNNDDSFGEQLALQILISILKMDINYHYENVSFIFTKDGIRSLAPPFDHEYSIPFLFPDDDMLSFNYFGTYCQTLMTNKAINNGMNSEFILKNIITICKKYPNLVKTFLAGLKRLIDDLSKTDLVFPTEFSEAFSSHLFEVYEAIYKEHETSQKLSDIRKFSLSFIDMANFSDVVRQSVIQSATILYRNLEMNLDAQKLVRKEG